ncbi:DUF924 family protein [Carnobacterium sp.]|uniref:DUF924 family protein n=1 Tax=Carnobacterium sp. TaxID=48221 RepID=UPI003C759270
MSEQEGSKDYQKVLDFWFKEIQPKQHFIKSKKFDEEIRTRFQVEHQRASKGELVGWRESIEGCLAEIIILDQFSRNMYRNQPRSFAYDGMALVLAQEALKHRNINDLRVEQLSFLYMPFMHSESLVIHEFAVNYFKKKGLENSLNYEKAHQAILLQFGRYPHRNSILGRESTPEEIAFLKEPGSSF